MCGIRAIGSNATNGPAAVTKLIVTAFLVLHLAAAGWLSLKPDWRPGGQVLVLMPPDAPAAAALATVVSAGGQPVRSVGNAILATSDREDFPANLGANGAWLVLNSVVAGGCSAARNGRS